MTKIRKINYKYGVVKDTQNREYPEFGNYVGTFHGNDVIAKGITTFEQLIKEGTLESFRANKLYQFYEIKSENGELKWVFEGQYLPKKSSSAPISSSQTSLADDTSLPSGLSERKTYSLLSESLERLKGDLSQERLLKDTINKEWQIRYDSLLKENESLRASITEVEKQYKELLNQKLVDVEKIAKLESSIEQLNKDHLHKQTQLQDSFIQQNTISEIKQQLNELNKVPPKTGLFRELSDAIREKATPENIQMLVQVAPYIPEMISKTISSVTDSLERLMGRNNASSSQQNDFPTL